MLFQTNFFGDFNSIEKASPCLVTSPQKAESLGSNQARRCFFDTIKIAKKICLK
jgi:hypothetical protein